MQEFIDTIKRYDFSPSLVIVPIKYWEGLTITYKTKL